MMRTVSTVVIALLWFAPVLQAKPSEDWKKVEGLAWDTPVRVDLWGGQEFVGRVEAVDATTLRLKVPSREAPGQTATSVTFARNDVHVVARLGPGGRDPGNTLRTGVAVGAAGGAIAMGIASGRAWPLGALAGGFGGAMAGTIAGGVVAVVKDRPRGGRVLYESQQRPPVPRPPEAKR